jgi:hypothetical protein
MNNALSTMFSYLLLSTTMLATLALVSVLSKLPNDLTAGIAVASYVTYMLFAGIARTLLAIRERLELLTSLTHPEAFAEEEKKGYW